MKAYFDLKLLNANDEEQKQIWKEIYKDTSLENFSTDAFMIGDIIKWTEHEKFFREFSKKYPEVIFELCIERVDEWGKMKKYFKNGKLQTIKQKTVWEDTFSEKKLK